MPKIGGTKAKSAAVETEAPAWFTAYKQEQEAKVASLEAQLAAAKSAPTASAGQRVYAPAITTPEQARSLTASDLRDLAHAMVKVVPGSPKTSSNPYGTPVLVQMKGSPNKMVAMKDGLDRGDYIKLRKIIDQIVGDFWSYREPAPLTDEQVKGILCPTLDRLGENGAKLFSW